MRISDWSSDVCSSDLDHPRRSRSKSMRGKLLLTPEGAPEVRSLLTLSYTDSYGPQAALIARPFDALEYGYESSPRFRTRASVAISDTNWEVSDDIALSAFLTASDFRVNRYTTPDSGIAPIDGHETSEAPTSELQSH